MRKQLIKIMTLLACLSVCRVGATDEPQHPNVLFIAIDDLNDWIGCLGGHPQAQTPNIDRLAARGVLFTNAHCAAPACNPSRAAVFSGRMPYHTGVWSNDSPQLPGHQPDLLLLPGAFSNAGYVTLGTGKLLHSSSANKRLFDQHFNTEQRWSPFTREQVRYTSEELPTKGTDNPRHIVKLSGQDPIVLPLNRMPSDRNPESREGESFDWGPLDVPEASMGDAQITDWAVRQLAGSSDRPFFLAVGYYRPHIPLWAPRKYFQTLDNLAVDLPPVQNHDLDDLSDSGRRWALEPVTAGRHSTVVQYRQWPAAVIAYLACVNFVDQQIGRLLETLDSQGLRANTLIVLWTDHGWHLGEKQHWGKWTGWERSTRVPLIIVPPGNNADRFAKPGSRCAQPVSLIDLYPTLVELCHLDPPDALDGQSLVPLLCAPNQPTGRTVVTTFDPGNVTLRTDHWRYIRYADGSDELYDHESDRHEWKNLASDPKHAPRLLEFRRRIPQAATSASAQKNR